MWLCLFLTFLAIVVAQQSFYDFSVTNGVGEVVPLSKYKDAKVVIVVNVASNCGYTYSNYRELMALYDKYREHGLEIIAFPSNQFGEQEPGTNQEIQTFVRNYGVNFPVMAKVDVNGPTAHEVFRFLKEGTGRLEINWNFNKFVVVDGQPVRRYVANFAPRNMERDLRPLLGLPAEDEL